MEAFIAEKVALVEELLKIANEIMPLSNQSVPDLSKGWTEISPASAKGLSGENLKLVRKLTKTSDNIYNELIEEDKIRGRKCFFYGLDSPIANDKAALVMRKAVVDSFQHCFNRLRTPQSWIIVRNRHVAGTYLGDLKQVSIKASWPVEPVPNDGEMFFDFLSQGKFEIDPFPEHRGHKIKVPLLLVYGTELNEAFQSYRPAFWKLTK